MDFNGGRPIVVLAPHPDDESLGCGALLAACFATSGAHIVCVTDGRRSHPNSVEWPGDRLARLRERELTTAVQRLGGTAADITFLRYRDCHAPRDRDARASAVGRIVALCDRLGARGVFSASPRDPHCDHQATADIARDVVVRRPALRLFFYPVWSRWHDPSFEQTINAPVPCVFESSRWRLPKLAAIAAHRSQRGLVVRDDPDGFVMQDDFIRLFASHDETFLEVSV